MVIAGCGQETVDRLRARQRGRQGEAGEPLQAAKGHKTQPAEESGEMNPRGRHRWRGDESSQVKRQKVP